ncbi:MAG: putative siderophore transport system ATP-binding protein YusV [Syntrophorhabdus sp. PtaU1.Bin002]|nr:MAG: putative siderophore transport system ATP-binding protein YusV [Syntrophorhabdus sp. PtaB.Bin006]OPY73721.1 MAG: putative siderophore transport system ATP-binding protein YusV [Syntrophorhabdus sp. PtaU1.Bin002]
MIEIRHFTGGYGSKVILNDIDLDVNRGEFVGIIGPNGSGKTTLVRAIVRLLRTFGGTIRFEGKDIRQMGFKELAKRVAVVSQNPPVMAMTVKEYVLLGRVPHYGKLQLFETEADIRIAERSMMLTDTLAFKNRYISETSGGEIQLALIARALTQEPALLILDEPTAHLDITHQVSVLDLIRRLNRELGLTVLIVLHDLNLASEYCDRIVLMDGGRIRKTGRPEEVLNYKDIEEVYRTVVVVEKNPLSLKPFVLIVPEEVKKRCER